MKTICPRFTLSLVACGLLLSTFTGCMISPNDGDVIEHLSTPVYFLGGTFTPDQDIDIQAYHPTNGWITIGSATTSAEPYPQEFYGQEYYYFYANIPVPSSCWSVSGGGFLEAEVRCVTADGSSIELLAFTDSFDNFFYKPNIYSAADVLQFTGNGYSATIYAPMSL